MSVPFVKRWDACAVSECSKSAVRAQRHTPALRCDFHSSHWDRVSYHSRGREGAVRTDWVLSHCWINVMWKRFCRFFFSSPKPINHWRNMTKHECHRKLSRSHELKKNARFLFDSFRLFDNFNLTKIKLQLPFSHLQLWPDTRRQLQSGRWCTPWRLPHGDQSRASCKTVCLSQAW